MKKVFLILVLNLTIFITGQNFTLAQDPNDPGAPDTVRVSRIDMDSTLNPLGWPKPFAIKCSVFTDEFLFSATIPITFYHSENLDIFVDSVVASPGFNIAIQNDSVAYPNTTPKAFKVIGFNIPAGRSLFTVYFNGDFWKVLNWDTTKGIVLDTTQFSPPDPPKSLEFIGMFGVFKPVFQYGLIGGAVTISGTVYKPDGVTPDSGAEVFFRGKDKRLELEEDTLFVDGRNGAVKVDASGNYQIVVGKDAYWCVFRDTSGQMIKDVNAYCYDSLTADVSGIDFFGKYLPGQGAVISGVCYSVPPTPKENKKVYLDGDINDSTKTNTSGYYEFNVHKAGKYCIRVVSDPLKACNSTFSYIFNLLMNDTLYNDFKENYPGGWVFISGTTWKTPPEPLPDRKVYLTGLIRAGVNVIDSTSSDASGNYKFRIVENGVKYYVFMDTTGGLDTTYNAYFFEKPKVNISNIDFIEPGIPGGWVKISGLVFHSPGVPWKNATVYLIGYGLDRKDSTSTDSLGNYEFDVLMGSKYCVFIDTTGGMNPPINAYCFDSLVTDTANNNFEATTDVEEESKEAVPEHFALFQNYPNPFNPYTLIRFALPEDCRVKLEVYNILGQKIKTLADDYFTKGVREVVWDGKNQKGKEVATGIYFYRIKTEKYTEIKKMALLR